VSPQNCLFWDPGFGTPFDQILRSFLLLYLLSPWLAEFAASIILLEDAKYEIAALSPAGCI